MKCVAVMHDGDVGARPPESDGRLRGGVLAAHHDHPPTETAMRFAELVGDERTVLSGDVEPAGAGGSPHRQHDAVGFDDPFESAEGPGPRVEAVRGSSDGDHGLVGPHREIELGHHAAEIRQVFLPRRLLLVDGHQWDTGDRDAFGPGEPPCSRRERDHLGSERALVHVQGVDPAAAEFDRGLEPDRAGPDHQNPRRRPRERVRESGSVVGGGHDSGPAKGLEEYRFANPRR